MTRKTRAWIAGTGGAACFLMCMFLLGWIVGVRDSSGVLTKGVMGGLQFVGITALALVGVGIMWAVMAWVDKGDE